MAKLEQRAAHGELLQLCYLVGRGLVDGTEPG